MYVLPQSDPATLILPRLWIGNAASAKDPVFLKNNDITVVFNCTKDLPFHSSIRRCYRVPVDDNLERSELRNMELWSFEIVAKLSLEYKSGRTILVHCHAGMQRSCAVVAMFLIATQKMNSDDAMLYIQQRRPIAFMPSANFEPSIKGFERSLQKALEEPRE
jgi:protein tyrosine/serine phosphatase